MGKITTVRESNNIVDMSIFDGTGTYVVHFYSSDVDDAVSGSMKSIWQVDLLSPTWSVQSVISSCACEQMAQRIAEWRPGVYVRVYGNVSDFDDNWRIQAYNIRTITDFNEVRPLLD